MIATRAQMTLDQVRYFLVLCRELNFTRAAKMCGISQPSLSNAIRALEAEFGGPLFHRSPQVRLSELGERIKPLCERIEAAVAEARLLAMSMRSQRNGRSVAGHVRRDRLKPSELRAVGRQQQGRTAQLRSRTAAVAPAE